MLNKAQIIGHLGAKPELRKTNSGTAVCDLSVATTERWKDKQGEMQEQTEWHRVILWDRAAENAAKFLDKGSLVFVEGKLQTRKWEDKDQITRYTTEIVAQNIRFLDRKGGGASRSEAPSSQDENFDDRDIPF